MTFCYSFLLVAALVQAQSAILQGVVTDPSQGAIPGATVSAVRGGKVVLSVKSDAKGVYQVTGLANGSYSIRASAPGFAPFELASYDVGPGTQVLDVSLSLRAASEQVTVTDRLKVDLDPASNAGALVLQKDDLEALSDDPDDFATDLQALAGPAAGPNGGQIYIDGFTGGRLPMKQSIREVRINQNPFAAQFDKPGQGRIEIFTKPGTDEFHGQLLFQFSDAALNSRNPFVSTKPPYQRRQWEGEFSGPLGKKTSFFFDFERRDIDENAFINATILDQNLNPTPFSQALVTPLSNVEMNFKVDRQLSKNHTLTGRYTYARDASDNQGIGGFSLASRAYNVHDTEDTVQLSETGVLNQHTINETRFRFRRQGSDQSGGGVSPTISVLDAFSNGGSPVGTSFHRQKRYELQNSTSYVVGKHATRWGALMRGVSLTDQSMQNYSGTFTFTTLETYRLTLLGIQQNLSPAQVRASGGGASQFSLSEGNPLADLKQFDFGFFAQDDYRIRSNLTLSGGLRYETQTHTGDHSDLSPRLAFAWGLGNRKKGSPQNVIRGGFGIFYDRLSESLTLDALRQDGIRQQQFLIPSPDFYPTIPSAQSLAGSAQPQTIRKTDANWQAPRLMQFAIGYERQLPKNITISTNYIHSMGVHALRSRDINAPLPGTGLYPFGGLNGIYLYETSGLWRQNQLITNLNARVSKKLTFSALYAYGSAHSNTDGAGTFPANSYDLSSEYGRAGYDVRHRFQLNGSMMARWGLRFSPLVTLASGRPFNIISGTDRNGDGLYTDRPAFATDFSRPSVVSTPLGIFDVSPLSGQKIVPRNYGKGPGQITLNLRVGKTFLFGESGAKGKKTSADPKQLTLSVNARNLLNHQNFGLPDGNLSSPVFGTSTNLASGQGLSGNRRLDLQIRFDF